MGDISMRGKGRALKMKSGGSTTERRKKAREDQTSRVGPKTKRPGPIIKPLRPNPKPLPRDPKKIPEFRPKLKGKPEAKPMPKFGIGPVPIPRSDRPNMKPMPYKKPIPPKDLKKYMMQEPRKMTPAMMGLKSILSKAASGPTGVPAGTLKKAYEIAKKFKPSGRLNMDDIKRALGTMGAAKK